MDSIRSAEQRRIESGIVGKYGVPFLDDFLVGIAPKDLVIIAAPTGAGKTELVYDIAYSNSRDKRVALFALEADQDEPKLRRLFKIVAKLYYDDTNQYKAHIDMSYRNFTLNQIDVSKYMPRALEIYEMHPEPEIIYRDGSFNIDTFKQKVLEKNYDLLIIDHLDYFDLNENSSENMQISEIMKTLRDVNQLYGIPIIAVSHLRKTSNKAKMPTANDLMGSSNKAKQAKTLIMLAPDYEYENADASHYSTFFSVEKSRAGGTGKYLARQIFDVTRNAYKPTYDIVKHNRFNDEVEIIEEHKYPAWANKKKPESLPF